MPGSNPPGWGVSAAPTSVGCADGPGVTISGGRIRVGVGAGVPVAVLGGVALGRSVVMRIRVGKPVGVGRVAKGVAVTMPNEVGVGRSVGPAVGISTINRVGVGVGDRVSATVRVALGVRLAVTEGVADGVSDGSGVRVAVGRLVVVLDGAGGIVVAVNGGVAL